MSQCAPQEFIGQDANVLQALERVRRVADAAATVLITGESGTGKDLLARALHQQSRRRERAFVAINCAALPRELLESELFGHEKGAFTGATERRIGRIELAHRGTLFLDEVDHLSPELQAKLLRFLQSGEVVRLGGREPFEVDTRVVAASSSNLRELLETGEFLPALYYRLHVVPVRLPPLRERRGDIPLLVSHFLAKYGAIYDREVELAPAALARLARWTFPGNVRELENLVHRLVALADGPMIQCADLPREMREGEDDPVASGLLAELSEPLTGPDDLESRRRHLDSLLKEQQLELAERTIDECGGNVSRAADRLGIHRVTLHRILQRRESSPDR